MGERVDVNKLFNFHYSYMIGVNEFFFILYSFVYIQADKLKLRHRKPCEHRHTQIIK